MAVVTGDELAAAVAACGFTCVECGSTTVRLDHAPALGWVPVIVHWPVVTVPVAARPWWQRWLRRRLPVPAPVPAQWCPALSGGPAAELASRDLLDAIFGAVTVGEREPEPWHRRERVSA